MARPRFEQLIRELEAATRQGKIRWQTTAKEGVFRVGLGDGMVRIEPGYSEQNGSYIVAYLVDRQGRVIDENWIYKTEDPMKFVRMEDLYRDARASALDVDKVIESMLDDLEAGKTRELSPDSDRF